MRPTDVPDQGLLCDLLWSDPGTVVVKYFCAMLNIFLLQTRTRWAGGRTIGACPSHLGRRLWQSFYINMTLTWYAEHIRWDTLNIFVPSFAKHFCTMLNIFLNVVHYRWWKTDTSSLPSDSWWLCSLHQTTAESLIMQVKFIHSILPQFFSGKSDSRIANVCPSIHHKNPLLLLSLKPFDHQA